MSFSVVICTFNREGELRKTLDSFRPIAKADPKDWELIVVDNNSTDGTKAVCEEFRATLPLRYAFEGKQGQAAALNHAARIAQGEVILFTDDDVVVDAQYIEGYRKTCEAEPDAAYYGGKVLSRWQGEPPRWFKENHEWLRSNPRVDFGEASFRIDRPDAKYFIGANIAFRKSVFDGGLRFHEERGCIGRHGIANSSHSDVNFLAQEELLGQGRFGVYAPDSVVHHRDPLERMTERYIRYFYVQNRIEQVLRGKVPDSEQRWLGAPRHLWRTVAVSSIKYACTRWRAPSKRWLEAEVKAAAAWGDIKGFRRLRKGGASE